MIGDHEQDDRKDRRAHWAKIPGVLLQGFTVVGALLIIVVGLWTFDRPTSPTQKQEFFQALGVLLATLVGLSGLYFMQVLATYARRRAGLETGPISKDTCIIALVGADLRGANLRMGNLSGVNLSMADLSHADLRGANLRMDNLSGANLSMADLSRADLREADLREANLRTAILLRTNLRVAILTGADLQRVLMSNATLVGADLREANLSMANLSGVNLRQADLSRANLSGAFGWTDAQFSAASSLESATMPDGQMYETWLIDKESHWEDVENPGPSNGRGRPPEISD
jgi:uncharacterized protein YjbI with pentapeptide repeats